MTSRPVVILANEDTIREALQLLAETGIDVTLAHPSPALALPPVLQAANGRRYRLAAVKLSDREIQVLQLMAEGNSNPEIGVLLGLAANTVKSHVKRIFRRLNVDDRALAVAVGIRTGLIGGAA